MRATIAEKILEKAEENDAKGTDETEEQVVSLKQEIESLSKLEKYRDVFEQYQEALRNNMYYDIMNGYFEDYDRIGEYASWLVLSYSMYD